MGVSSIILGRPWLYDHDATLFDKTNSCSFNHLGKKIVIHPVPPKDVVKKGASSLKKKTPGLNLINVKELQKEIVEGSPIWILTAREIRESTLKEPPLEVLEVLEEF